MLPVPCLLLRPRPRPFPAADADASVSTASSHSGSAVLLSRRQRLPPGATLGWHRAFELSNSTWGRRRPRLGSARCNHNRRPLVRCALVLLLSLLLLLPLFGALLAAEPHLQSPPPGLLPLPPGLLRRPLRLLRRSPALLFQGEAFEPCRPALRGPVAQLAHPSLAPQAPEVPGDVVQKPAHLGHANLEFHGIARLRLSVVDHAPDSHPGAEGRRRRRRCHRHRRGLLRMGGGKPGAAANAGRTRRPPRRPRLRWQPGQGGAARRLRPVHPDGSPLHTLR